MKMILRLLIVMFLLAAGTVLAVTAKAEHVQKVPEPAWIAPLGLALVGVSRYRRRRTT